MQLVLFLNSPVIHSLTLTPTKVEAPITNRGPIVDFIFKCHTFLRHISMKGINNCLKLKLSEIGSSSLLRVPDIFFTKSTSTSAMQWRFSCLSTGREHLVS
jgi:hypothetical protein